MPRESYARLETDVRKRLEERGYSEKAAQEFWHFYRKNRFTDGSIGEEGLTGRLFLKRGKKLELSDYLQEGIASQDRWDHTYFELQLTIPQAVELLGIDIVQRLRIYQEKMRLKQVRRWDTICKTHILYVRDEETGEYKARYPPLRVIK